MRIILINGGLGNQLFQYLFYRFAQRYCPEETWYLDDSFFFMKDEYRPLYELERIWGIKANLLSNYFDEDVWKEIIRLRKEEKTSLPTIFSNMGISLTMVAETSDCSYQGKVLMTPANQFRPDILRISEEDVYYHGYWINRQWFAQYREENLAELAFPKLTDPQNLRYAEMIQSCLSVGIHIRRGDFVTLGWALPVEFYKQSCEKILDTYKDAHFFVFTDDVDWCRANAEALGLDLAPSTVYVTGNHHERSYIDMQLMSMCMGLIMSNSSFCYFAALMDQNLRFIINPTQREV